MAWTMGGVHPVLGSGLLRGYRTVDSPWMQFTRVLVGESVDAALARYRALLKKYSSSEIIPEYPMNGLGYAFLGKDQFQVAIAIFKLNAEVYPESSNVYDSLGEAYFKNGDLDLAIQNYEKSLSMNPENENGRRMLNQIREQASKNK